MAVGVTTNQTLVQAETGNRVTTERNGVYSTRPTVPPRVAGILPARGEGVPPLRPSLPVTTPANPTAPQPSSRHQKPSRIA